MDIEAIRARHAAAVDGMKRDYYEDYDMPAIDLALADIRALLGALTWHPMSEPPSRIDNLEVSDRVAIGEISRGYPLYSTAQYIFADIDTGFWNVGTEDNPEFTHWIALPPIPGETE